VARGRNRRRRGSSDSAGRRAAGAGNSVAAVTAPGRARPGGARRRSGAGSAPSPRRPGRRAAVRCSGGTVTEAGIDTDAAASARSGARPESATGAAGIGGGAGTAPARRGPAGIGIGAGAATGSARGRDLRQARRWSRQRGGGEIETKQPNRLVESIPKFPNEEVLPAAGSLYRYVPRQSSLLFPNEGHSCDPEA
jgi:hypothetical protein